MSLTSDASVALQASDATLDSTLQEGLFGIVDVAALNRLAPASKHCIVGCGTYLDHTEAGVHS